MYFNGNEIVEIRNYLIKKLTNCTLQDWRLILAYISKINPREQDQLRVIIPVDDYCQCFGLKAPGADYIRFLTTCVERLQRIAITGKDPENGIIYSRVVLFPEASVTKQNDELFIELVPHQKALPLLFGLKNYVKFKASYGFSLGSTNQLLMYLFLKEQIFHKRSSFEISVEELKATLGIGPKEYVRFGDFTNAVLIPCKKALAEKTDIAFTFEKGKIGAHRKCITIKFKVELTTTDEIVLLPATASANETESCEMDKIVSLCKKHLQKNKLNGTEICHIENWIKDFHVSEELVEHAFNDNMFRERITLKNIDETLSKWHKHGISTVAAATSFCEKEHQRNKSLASLKHGQANTATPWRSAEEANSLNEAVQALSSISTSQNEINESEPISTSPLEDSGINIDQLFNEVANRIGGTYENHT